MRLRAGTSGSSDIWLVHRDSLDSPRPFLTEAYTEISPRISPDGRMLAYVTNRTGSNEVYIRPIVGGGGELKPTAAPNRSGYEKETSCSTG